MRSRNSPSSPAHTQRSSPRVLVIARKQSSNGSVPHLKLKSSDPHGVSPPVSFPAVARSPRKPGKVPSKARSQATTPERSPLPKSSSKALLLPATSRSPARQLPTATARVLRGQGSPDARSRVAGVASATKVGRSRAVPKTHNQDSFLVVQRFGTRADAALFGVFDGHGAYGHDVSRFLRDHFEDYVSKGMRKADLGNPELVIDALKDGFRAANIGVRKGTVDSSHSGSTCLVVVVVGDICFCGNVGDSRAVLLRRSGAKWTSIPLSRDHKPTVEEERARIVERGGVIAQYSNSAGVPGGPLRVWLPDQPVPGLAMTRSIGDRVASKIGVIGEPEVQQLMLSREDEALLLASDGLWEVVSNDEVASVVAQHSDSAPAYIAERLMEEAQRRWARSGVNWDDTTLVFVRLRPSQLSV